MRLLGLRVSGGGKPLPVVGTVGIDTSVEAAADDDDDDDDAAGAVAGSSLCSQRNAASLAST
jgi:hypothetical protein